MNLVIPVGGFAAGCKIRIQIQRISGKGKRTSIGGKKLKPAFLQLTGKEAVKVMKQIGKSIICKLSPLLEESGIGNSGYIIGEEF